MNLNYMHIYKNTVPTNFKRTTTKTKITLYIYIYIMLLINITKYIISINILQRNKKNIHTFRASLGSRTGRVSRPCPR